MQKWIWRLLVRLWNGPAERADVVFDAYQKLLRRQQEWNESVEHRLRDCEEDRDRLTRKVDELTQLVEELKEQIQSWEDRTQ